MGGAGENVLGAIYQTQELRDLFMFLARNVEKLIFPKILTLDLDLLSIDSSVLLIDIVGKLAVLGLEPIEGRLDMSKLFAQLFLLLVHTLIVRLDLTLQRRQIHEEVRALRNRTEYHGSILSLLALLTMRQYLPCLSSS